MAATSPRRVGWRLRSFPPSACTFRNAFIFLSASMIIYTILALTGVVDSLNYHQLVTDSQSLVPSSWSFFKHGSKGGGGEYYTAEDHEQSKFLASPPPPSDELSDFHVYNISKTGTANATKTWTRPQLHVLVDARHYHPTQERTNLRRTLLSVVIQGYPPPILIGYRQPDVEGRENEKEEVSSTEAFLRAALDAMEYTKLQSGGKQEKIFLFLGRNQWVQMPAEVTVRRFLQHKEVWGRRLAREYGFSSSSDSEGSIGRAKDGEDSKEKTDVEGEKKYGLRVLFPASRRKFCAKGDKVCNLGIGSHNDTTNSGHSGREEKGYRNALDLRDNILPESSLPRDIYGTFLDPDSPIPTRFTRPRYLSGGSFIGSSEDVEKLFRGALERIDSPKNDEGEGNGASEVRDGGYVDELAYLFSEMFFEQEIERKRLQELDFISRQDLGERVRRKRRWAWPVVNDRGLKHSFLDLFTHVVEGKGHPPTSTTNSSQQQNKTNKIHEYEFGIGLDYESRIFQDMADDLPKDSNDNGNSAISVQVTNDIRYLYYNVPNLARSPSQSAAQLFQQPLMLTPELLHPLSPNGTSSPFGLNSAIYNNLATILEEARKVKVIASADDIDQQKLREQGRKPKRQEPEEVDAAGKNEQAEKNDGEENITKLGKTVRVPWSSFDFATNVVVPRGSIPSVLDMSRFGRPTVPPGAEKEREGEKKDGGHGEDAGHREAVAQRVLDEHWEKMWFNQKTRRPPPPPHKQPDKPQKRDDGDDDGKVKTGTEAEIETTPAKYGLLSEYIKPSPFIYALESEAWGGRHNNWWNVRGGRGGFWTDQGAWVSWYDICGDIDV